MAKKEPFLTGGEKGKPFGGVVVWMGGRYL